jgi:predicted aspartyl protease
MLSRDERLTILAIAAAAILIAGAWSAYYWYNMIPSDRFSSVYNQLKIEPLPRNVESRDTVQSRLEQLSREPCYRDAVGALSDALIDAGFPREGAAALLSFTSRCPGSNFLLAGAYQALMTIGDTSGAFRVADKLANEYPAQPSYRYWRARAYDELQDFPRALSDYINTVQLVGDLRSVNGDAFYNMSRMYAALGRYCDAITPIETYISLDLAARRTPQTTKIISEYAEKGHCDLRFARGVARVPFVGAADVHTLPVSINGVIGNFILDTGATYVSVTSAFSEKAKINIEAGNQIVMKTVGGVVKADIGRAAAVAVGKAEAFDVVVAVVQERRDPFGGRLDGLLGMSYLARFNLKLSQTGIELAPIPLR